MCQSTLSFHEDKIWLSHNQTHVCLLFTLSCLVSVLLLLTLKFVLVLFTKAGYSFVDSLIVIFGPLCFCAAFLWCIFLFVWILLSFRPLWEFEVFKVSVAVWFVFGFTLSLTLTVVFLDFCFKVFFFACVLAFFLFSILSFFHGFSIFFFFVSLSDDFGLTFTAVPVVELPAAVIVGLIWLLLTGGLVGSLNFLGGGLVGFSFVPSTVTEMAQMSISTHFHHFTLLQPHVLSFF